jgi:hypothetical protein
LPNNAGVASDSLIIDATVTSKTMYTAFITPEENDQARILAGDNRLSEGRVQKMALPFI